MSAASDPMPITGTLRHRLRALAAIARDSTKTEIRSVWTAYGALWATNSYVVARVPSPTATDDGTPTIPDGIAVDGDTLYRMLAPPKGARIEVAWLHDPTPPSWDAPTRTVQITRTVKPRGATHAYTQTLILPNPLADTVTDAKPPVDEISRIWRDMQDDMSGGQAHRAVSINPDLLAMVAATAHHHWPGVTITTTRGPNKPIPVQTLDGALIGAIMPIRRPSDVQVPHA